MNAVHLKVKITGQKIIPHVSDEFAESYHLPEGHNSVAFFSADNDDAAYIAADDATKKARIKVVHAETFYGGKVASWSKNGGSILVLISGPRVEDVRSGLMYINDFISRQSELYCFDGDERTEFYAQTIAKSGKYFSERFGVEEGQPYCYLFGNPIESAYAIDKALRAGKTLMTRYWMPPSVSNSCGAVLSGTESACKTAVQAYIEALRYATENPDAI